VEGGQDRQLRVLSVVSAALELVDLQSERGPTGDGPEPPREERGWIVWSGPEQAGQLPGRFGPHDLPGELPCGARRPWSLPDRSVSGAPGDQVECASQPVQVAAGQVAVAVADRPPCQPDRL
jgi:hypothetical protein